MAILTSPTDGRTDEQAYARRWWTLAVLCLSLLIVFGGNSTLNVALPTLSRDLGASESQLQWVVAVYSLVFAGLLFTSGALGDDREQPLPAHLAVGEQHVFLGGEVAEEGPGRDLARLGDLLDGRRVVALLLKKPQRVLLDSCASLGLLPLAQPRRGGFTVV